MMNLNVVRFIMFYIVEFADCGSPALVQIHSSCVFKVR